jgi:hypothetical protein
MNNWKIISRIAIGLTLICVIFAIFAAFITYNGMNLNPGYYTPEAIQLSVVSSMLLYLFYASLSVVVAGFSMRAGRESAKVEAPLPKEEPKQTPEEEFTETLQKESTEKEA